MEKKIVFLGMGGTIAGRAASASDNVGYTAGQVPIQGLLASVPALATALAGYRAEAEQVCQIDSKDLAHTDWLELTQRALHHLRRDDIAGLVIIHGTDTLEETAYWLWRQLPAELVAAKPVVLTCAMRPASSHAPDGPGNLTDAASLAAFAGAKGVWVVCAGKIHSALHVQKIHPYQVDALDSGEAGPVGVIEEGRVRLLSAWLCSERAPEPLDCEGMDASLLPRVEIVMNHAGASGALVRSLLNVVDGDPPLRGLVVAGTGNGTLHKDLEQALHLAQARGVRVVRVSRCAYGQVVTASAPTGPGEFAVYGLSAVKARIALMLDIAARA